VALHAYALMNNHVRLLLTPRDRSVISRLMQLYDALGPTPGARQSHDREPFRSRMADAELHEILACLEYNYPLDNEGFRAPIVVASGRGIAERKRGRPFSRATAPD
jgi:hypothetical protein